MDSLNTQAVATKAFACTWTSDGQNGAWVHVAGDLDIATCPELERTLTLAQGQAHLVVVDLRGVGFADSAAVHAIVDASIRAQREGNRLVVLRGPPHVDRVFALSPVCDGVEFVDLEACPPPVLALLRLVGGEGAVRVGQPV